MQKLSEEELVSIVGEAVVGTPSGLKSQQAQAELIRRQIVEMRKNNEATNRFNKTTEKYNNVTIDLTFVLLFVSFLQVVYAIFLSGRNQWVQIYLLILFFVGILLVMKYISKWSKYKAK
jgi:hypothetical protein